MQFVSHIPADKPRKHVFIGVGAGDGTVEVPCVLALFASAPLLRAAGISTTLCIEAGNCHVDDMRNGVVATFLESDADQLVFIDEDVGFDPIDLVRLIQYDRAVVGGVYPKKEDDENFPVFTEPGTELWADSDGLVAVQGLPTGFLKIQRHVLETLRDEAVCFIGSDGREYHVIFERLVADGRRWSGDYGFCRKWLAKGGELFADPAMTFTHTGKKTWGGSLGDFWLRKHGIEGEKREKILSEAVSKAVLGECDVEALAQGWGNAPWAASPAFLSAIWDKAGDTVLECGSGVSTLLLAAMGCKVTALEHDEAHAGRVLLNLKKFGLEHNVEIICRPLKMGWYDYAGGEFDTLVIDGPPRQISDRSIALSRVNAKVILWDDYDGGLDNPEIHEGAKTFAIKESVDGL